jgi:hypothetical protein
MMLDDMDDLFRTRLRQLMRDHFDTCLRADLDQRDVAEIILRALLAETVWGSMAIRMERDAFTAMCSEAYRLLRPQFDRNVKPRRKSH